MSRDGWMKKKANSGGDNGWAERGGYMAAKVSKLDEQFKLDAPREKQKDGSCSSIFSGVSIYVNGYTEPSADELRRLMMLHGGQFHVYYSRSKTTHIIATNLPNSKIKELKGEKVIRPEWITDSIKAGRLLPYLQYQLYAKYKGPLFPGMTLRQTSEIAGPSQASVHHKLHLPPRSLQHSVLNHEQSSSSSCQNNSVPPPGKSRLHQGNIQPQSNQHNSAAHSFSPQPSFSDPRHGDPLHTFPYPTKHLHKPPQSTLQTPHPSVQHQRAGQPQPQISSSCSSAQVSCKKAESKINGLMQTSLAVMSHSKLNEMQECGKDPLSQVVNEAPLTNGHAHLVNGALKPEDLSPVTDRSSVDKELPESRFKISEDKPQNPHTKHDPYEFPHSPPKQSDHFPVFPEHSSSQGASGQRPPPPTYQEAMKATENHLKPLQPSCHVNSDPEKSPFSPTSRALSHAPVRLNGSHHNAFSFDSSSLNTSDVTTKPDPPTEKSSPSKSSAQLLAQTGGLISEFYSHSRLHQISTWRSGFSEYVNELHSKRKAAGANSFSGKERLRKSVAQHSTYRQGMSASIKSCILHVDMDCFFVSVGIRHRPDLKGKPVAVTSNRGEGRVPRRAGANPQLEQQYYQRKYAKPQPERAEEDLYRTPSQESPESHTNGVDQDAAAALSMAEIASCSYEARQAGVRNGMFFGRAKQLCPALQSVPYDFEAYKEVALTMYETLASYTHDIEALSCDEVLIDASALIGELGVSPADLAGAIRADIKEKTGCCASVGMGSNILLARLATRKAKPDGQYFLKSEEVDDFIRDLPVTSLPGVGPVMGRKLAAMGVRSCGDLQQVSLSQLQKKFGPRTGQTLFRFCRGLDDRPVRYEKERKSVSAEMNYNIRFTRVDEAECFLTNLSMEVQKRLQEAGLRGRRVTLKVMVRKIGAPLEPAKYGGHGICDNLARTVMLAESTDSGQLIATAVIKLFHAMKLQVQDLRGIGIQVQLLEGNQSSHKDTTGTRTRSIKEMLVDQRSSARSSNKDTAVNNTYQETTSSMIAPSSGPSPHPLSPPEPVPGTSRDQQACRQTPKHSRARLNLSIEVPSPSQVDRSVLEALPADLREQVEQSWMNQNGKPNNHRSPSPQPAALKSRPTSPPRPPTSAPALYTPPVGTLVLQIPNQPDSPGIVLELPNFSQVDPDVFAALPKELQEELKSAYNRVTNVQPQAKMSVEHKNPLLQLKQSGVGIGVGRVKRRYKRKNAVSPVKKGPSPVKRHLMMASPAKTLPPPMKSREPMNVVKTEYGPSTSTSKPDVPESKSIPRTAPALAGAYDLTDIKTLLREWVTTMTDPMEEDILQVVKYCTELIDDKDLEKLDLIIKYMKRLMQQSVESVWSMAFDFILDNVQVVVQQAYGSTLKIT
ncbi:DNA repair protein REV1 isoform X1 [Acanthopagrus latus]|uniref:DNA repair protein REV1 isoform X1 n=1 Tax=Acanthopagrus latus TaxID=8177 RepID=UPI00187C05EF|nr:DNA repair protein REV1 isoform X1 [Acanthopagrus latus]XP_036964868.1 DNA repair protein REV1 isoform X1 [Acanthopagrus latus]